MPLRPASQEKLFPLCLPCEMALVRETLRRDRNSRHCRYVGAGANGRSKGMVLGQVRGFGSVQRERQHPATLGHSVAKCHRPKAAVCTPSAAQCESLRSVSVR